MTSLHRLQPPLSNTACRARCAAIDQKGYLKSTYNHIRLFHTPPTSSLDPIALLATSGEPRKRQERPKQKPEIDFRFRNL